MALAADVLALIPEFLKAPTVLGIGGTIGALATALLMDGAINEAGGKLVAKGLLKGQRREYGKDLAVEVLLNCFSLRLRQLRIMQNMDTCLP